MSYVLFFVLLTLQVSDALTTTFALIHGAREANPIMRWCIEKLGLLWGLILPKALGMVAFGYLILMDWMPVHVLAVFCVFYGWVIYNNLQQLAKQ